MSAPFAPLETQRERLPSLDGWRALAIFLVFVSHAVYALDCPERVSRFVNDNVSGNLGVRVFFIISGFIITWLLVREGDKTGSVSLSRFYLRRCLRIFPIYFCYLATLAVLSYFGRYKDAPSSWLGALTFSRNILGRGDSATVHFWSLAVEEQFYICWPVAFKLLKLNKRIKTASIVLVAAIVVANGVRFFSAAHGHDFLQSDRIYGARSLFRYADFIAIGCLAAYFYASRKRLPKSLVYFAYILLIGDFVFGRFNPMLLSDVDWFWPTVEAAAIAVLIVDSIGRPKLYQILNTRLMISVGLLSYSLYVWHMIFVHHFAPDAAPLSWQKWNFWFLPAIVVACGSYYFVEAPVGRLKIRLSAKPADRPIARA